VHVNTPHLSALDALLWYRNRTPSQSSASMGALRKKLGGFSLSSLPVSDVCE